MSVKLTRRSVFGTAMAAGVLHSAPALAAAGGRRKLDLKNPADLLYAEIKMNGDLRDHHEVIQSMSGTVYAIFEDGKTLEPLFRVGSAAFLRTFRVDDSTYRSMANFVICYMALEEDVVLERWYNPWLKREVKVVNYASTLHTEIKASQLAVRTAKFHSEWSVDGNNVTRWTDGSVAKPNPITPDKWPKASVGATYYKNQASQMIARLDELEDTSRTSVDAVAFGQRHGPWYPWQEMGTAPGRTYRRDMTRKVARLSDISDAVTRYGAEHFPAYMSAPTEWTGAYIDPETLWARTMPPEVGEGAPK